MGQAVMQEKERRYIFNGEPRPSTSGYAVRQNRVATRRRMSTFTLILWMFAFGIVSVLYINNILAVNELALEVGKLERKLQEIRNVNDGLRAEVSTRASLDQLAGKASAQLGLRYATEQPVFFSVDEDLLDRVK